LGLSKQDHTGEIISISESSRLRLNSNITSTGPGVMCIRTNNFVRYRQLCSGKHQRDSDPTLVVIHHDSQVMMAFHNYVAMVSGYRDLVHDSQHKKSYPVTVSTMVTTAHQNNSGGTALP
jgi:hypothetical protein